MVRIMTGEKPVDPHVSEEAVVAVVAVVDEHGPYINASGHHQQLQRNFGLISLCALSLATGNAWVAQGGSVVVALSNGGLAGALYEFIAVSLCTGLITLSLGELASAMPSSSGVYHWASVTAGPKYGRICGFFAGFWNTAAWIIGAASMGNIMAQQLVSMYALLHPAYERETWHVFVAFVCSNLVCCAVVLYLNRLLPAIGNLGGFFILAGVVVTIVVCAVMPSVNGTGYASNRQVWQDWIIDTGYSQQGFVFVMGMLNGAFAIGTPDCASHLAEEIPWPGRNVPKAMVVQVATGFVTGFCYMIAIFYAIHDIDGVLQNKYGFPLAEIYYQASGTRSGALGLLVVAFLPCFITTTGCYIVSGRMVWTLARDNALPFSSWLNPVSPIMHNPFNATVVCGILVNLLACLYMGSTTAFNAFVSSFVQFSLLSYGAAIAPQIFIGRSNYTKGPFEMSNAVGYTVNILSCIYIMAFVVIFSFPYALPAKAASMNYTSLLTGGTTIFVGAWWFARRKSFRGLSGLGIAPSEMKDSPHLDAPRMPGH